MIKEKLMVDPGFPLSLPYKQQPTNVSKMLCIYDGVLATQMGPALAAVLHHLDNISVLKHNTSLAQNKVTDCQHTKHVTHVPMTCRQAECLRQHVNKHFQRADFCLGT